MLGDLDIWDIENECIVFPGHANIPFHETELTKLEYRMLSNGPRECIIEHPHTGLLHCASKGRHTVIDLPNKTIRQFETTKDLVGISTDGNFFFYLDSQSSLWANYGGYCQFIASDIVSVYPSISDSFELYAFSRSGYVYLFNISGDELAKAFVPDLWHAIPTKRGLAIATPRGPVLLTYLSPDHHSFTYPI